MGPLHEVARRFRAGAGARRDGPGLSAPRLGRGRRGAPGAVPAGLTRRQRGGNLTPAMWRVGLFVVLGIAWLFLAELLVSSVR